eukprot:3862449-Rhodomonas_salina.2
MRSGCWLDCVGVHSTVTRSTPAGEGRTQAPLSRASARAQTLTQRSLHGDADDLLDYLHRLRVIHILERSHRTVGRYLSLKAADPPSKRDSAIIVNQDANDAVRNCTGRLRAIKIG